MAGSAVVVIGDRDSVLGFGALGVKVLTPAPDPEEVRRAIGAALAGGAAVVFITERLARQIPETIAELSGRPLPSVVTIPDGSGSTGMGLSKLDEIIVRAVGSRPAPQEE
jgi:V/A-type H+-transporting ATPase subunit F